MTQVNIFLQSLESTFVALIQNAGHVLDGVLGLQVGLVGGALYAGVGAVGAAVGPHPGVPHLVPPEGVVVRGGVVALPAGERFLPRVLPRVQLQGGPGESSNINLLHSQKILN